MNKLVSIIVPVYNVEKYLKECVDSIINQTYSELEVILIDDGSSDESGIICDEYAKKDARVRVIHQKNQGLSEARNTGMRNAKGYYIYFCDSDDYLDREAIEVLTFTAEKTEVDCLFFNAEAFSDEGIQIRSGSYKRKHNYEIQNGMTAGFKQLLYDEYMPCIPLHFYKKGFLDAFSLTFKPGIYSEDELFSFYVYLNAEKVGYVDNAFYFRRMRQGSIMTTCNNLEKKFQSYVDIIFDMEKSSINAVGIEKKYCYEYLDRMTKSALLMYRRLDSDEKKNEKYNFEKLKNIILQYNGFGDISLIVRLYFWKIGVLLSGIRKYIRIKLYEERKGNICN